MTSIGERKIRGLSTSWCWINLSNVSPVT